MTWITDDLRVAEEGEVGLFVGCLSVFDFVFKEQLGVETIEIARSAIRVLNHLGIEPVVLEEERCCGHDQLWNGDGELFRALAKANAAAFAKRGIKHIITTCAECCRTWRLDYPEAVPEYQPKVEHLAEFLAPRLEHGEVILRSNGDASLTYQDPCRLGRHLEVYDAPRQVLSAMPGATVVEMERHGRDALCCGTSGFIHCDADSRRLQSERLGEAVGTGAKTLVTACPKCLLHFNCAMAEDRRTNRAVPGITIQDLTVLAAGMLNGSTETEKREKAVPEKEGQAIGEPR
jgi:Fe-S oxidoreductase